MKTKALIVEGTCTATFEAKIEVPEDMTLSEALEFADNHQGDIPCTNMEYLDNFWIDDESCHFAK